MILHIQKQASKKYTIPVNTPAHKSHSLYGCHVGKGVTVHLVSVIIAYKFLYISHFD